MGFFFFNVLDGFVPLARARGDETFAATCEQAREAVRGALECGWWGDHYALDFADDGRVVDMANAMTTGWAAYSGALDFERALIALEGGSEGDRAARPGAADRDAVLRAHPALSRPHRRLPAGRARERRPVQPRRDLDRRRLPPSGGRGARARRRETGGELAARAFEIFEKISPLKKTDPETIAAYGLIPIQQPADIYDGYGHGGRGGWSWYTGSAARMLSAAYALLGVSMTDGTVSVGDALFEPKGGLIVESLRIGERTWKRDGSR